MVSGAQQAGFVRFFACLPTSAQEGVQSVPAAEAHAGASMKLERGRVRFGRARGGERNGKRLPWCFALCSL
jgi:hypothetical protein